MSSVTLEEARARLAELIEQLQPEEEFIITDRGEPVALVKKAGKTPRPRKAGSAAGKIWIAPDFDEPLEDFKEYME